MLNIPYGLVIFFNTLLLEVVVTVLMGLVGVPEVVVIVLMGFGGGYL